MAASGEAAKGTGLAQWAKWGGEGSTAEQPCIELQQKFAIKQVRVPV